MGRIITHVTVENFAFPDQKIEFAAMVDTGASHVTLPLAWKDRLGQFPLEQKTTKQLADQQEQQGLVCGPAKIQVEGFRAVASELVFLDMQPDEGEGFEPLLGYLVLEQCPAAVDMLGHRLVPVKHLDLK